MRSQKRRCDASSCTVEAASESMEGERYVAPYHWVVAKGMVIGQGRFSVEVRSPTCLVEAVNEVWES